MKSSRLREEHARATRAGERVRRAWAIRKWVDRAKLRIAYQSRLHRAYGVIEGSFSTGISLSMAAAYAAMSKSAFERRFRSATGVSFHRFLVLAGLARAVELLETTDDSVTDVTLEAGFTLRSLEYNFKRHVRCSPSDYRAIRRSHWESGTDI